MNKFVKKESKFSINIPVYNEIDNLPILIKEIKNAINDINFLSDYEIILIDDASEDGSTRYLNNLIDKKIVTLFNKSNHGQSYSITKGIKNSKFRNIITLDADLQNNPKDIKLLYEKYIIEDELFLLGGIRNKRKDSYIKKISSKIANYIRSNILNDHCSDTGCSLKIFDRDSYLEFPYFDGIHRFLPALFKGYGHKTKFINVDHRMRKYGKSKYGTFKRLLKGIIDLIKVVKIIKKFKRNNV